MNPNMSLPASLLRLGYLSLSVFALSACGGGEQGTEPPASIPTSISKTSVDDQSVVAGAQVPSRPTVRVIDSRGAGVANVTVLFQVTSGGGGVSSNAVATNANGESGTDWILGPLVATNSLTATVANLPAVSFTARGIAGAASSISIVGGDNQSALPGSTIYNHAVRVLDANANPVPNLTVTFAVSSGGGSTAEPQRTNADGVATGLGWTLGTQSGTQTLRASVSETIAVMFTATARGIELVGLAAGGEHTCGLARSGAAYCWGANADGQLGDGTTVDRLKPTLVLGGNTFASLTAGASHTCGRTSNGVTYCWGANNSGQLGNGSLAASTSPVTVAGGLVFASVAAGGDHTCGIAGSPFGIAGPVYCWGANGSGQIGDGTTVSRDAPVLAGGTWLRAAILSWPTIATGDSHTCVISDETTRDPYCWGRQYNADGSTTAVLNPTVLVTGYQWGAVVAGGEHSCALQQPTVNGDFGKCWGLNSSGQFGDGSTSTSAPFATIAYSPFFRETMISAGGSHTCATPYANLRTLCWGDNTYGQLGDGTNGTHLSPTPVGGSVVYPSFAILSAGGRHTCGIASGGPAVCWGSNSKGQLGDGTLLDRSTPTLVSSP